MDQINNKMKYNNIIIIGWNSCSLQIIHFIKSINNRASFTLIDESLNKNPSSNYLKFIKGLSTNVEVLKQANVEKADFIFITANQEKNEVEADEQTLITLLSIKGINKKVHCSVELLMSKNIQHAYNVDADDVFYVGNIISSLMVNSVQKKFNKRIIKQYI
jgi:voltage-gated potassium channel